MSLSELTAAIGNTLAVMVVTVGLALPVGVLMAFLLVRTNVFLRSAAWIALGSQLAVPLYVFVGGWSAVLGTQGWLTSIGLGPSTWSTNLLASKLALLAVGGIHAAAALPWIVLIVAVGMAHVDRHTEEQAWLEGGVFAVLRRAIMPGLRFWLLAAVVWSVLPIMTEMVVTNLYQVPTVAEQAYLDASRGSIRPLTYVAAVLLCMVPLAIAFQALANRLPAWNKQNARGMLRAAGRCYDLRAWRIPASIVIWFSVFGLVGLPLASLFIKAGWKPFTRTEGATGYGWSLERFLTTVYESWTLFQSEYFWSGLLALLAASLALGSALTAYAISGKLGRWVIHALVLLLISVPGPLAGMLVIWLLNRSEPAWFGYLYDRTLIAPILAQQFRLFPLAWLLVNIVMASIPNRSWELSRLDGLGTLQRLSIVIWPHTRRMWPVACLLLWVWSIGELSCSILVLPPGVTTVSMRLFEMLHFGMRHQDSGLCGVLWLLGWIVSFAMWKTLRDR